MVAGRSGGIGRDAVGGKRSICTERLRRYARRARGSRVIRQPNIKPNGMAQAHVPGRRVDPTSEALEATCRGKA
jgi:hypothetical protein